MLGLIARDHEAEDALQYIDDRVSSSQNAVSSDLADRIAAIKAPPELEKKRESVIQHIRFWMRTRQVSR
jgi:hypothetical protein